LKCGNIYYHWFNNRKKAGMDGRRKESIILIVHIKFHIALCSKCSSPSVGFLPFRPENGT
jgi:predicted nucleic-acid-binding Zn-ribbon protein